jgi:hypothetical protein
MEGKSRRRSGGSFSCRGRRSEACAVAAALASGGGASCSVRSGGRRTGGVAFGLNGPTCVLRRGLRKHEIKKETEVG